MFDGTFVLSYMRFELLAPPSGRHEGASDRDMPRANGVGRLVLESSGEETRINELFQRAPIRIMFPKFGTTSAPEEAVLINTAGGIAGGDRLEYAITALANASIAVTSQAAEKVHRSLDEPSRITTRLGSSVPQNLRGFRKKRLSSI